MAGLDKAIAGATRWIETNLLADTVRVRASATAEPVLDPETGQIEYPQGQVVYEGPGAVIPSSPVDRRTAPEQSQPWSEQYRSSYLLLTPLTAPVLPQGALVEVTAAHSPVSAALLGRNWLTSDPGLASTVDVVRRTPLDQNEAPAGTP
ncbi:DUF6093 family protein [Streptomyces cinereoruber]|uniref:DUF6093 family protein n=1 Tax=Streptomyces cinereoruber TaxID=67260 RepID=UPI003638D387